MILHEGTQVTASINIFLRQYQREGIQFFFDRWKDGRGGVLGDDMGLVSFYFTGCYFAEHMFICTEGQNNPSHFIG